ncbi:flagellar hook protein [Burkholderia ubonensis]|uniref:flagellin N-terminal helical domain-containing protein n=1 Tax=Burkholderia ubonensis TaxID=101571 RepID=UPI00075663DD|nr:flagellar hook protein [Burkholderia ubonensis]KVO87720.1 flagellar hook protein [Burkholderia ubonensis]KVZ57336.1 flagellar hook protein [Burkholderia ubonensis]KVZ73034.1 flagellar hook protein [Burkholderia ubonensis]
MRIASQQFSRTMLSTLNASNGKAAELMQKISSGQRIQRASDDPVGAVRLMQLERDASTLRLYQKNIDTLSIRLRQNETRVDGMLRDAMSANDVLLAAIDGGRSPADLNAMAGPLRTLTDNLAHAVNARDGNGNYLFAGTLTGAPAFEYDADAPAGSRYRFAGNEGEQHVVIGDGVTQAANVGIGELERVLNALDLAAQTLADPAVDGSDAATRALLADALDALETDGIDMLSGKLAQLGGAQNTLTLMSDTHDAMLVANGQASTLVGELDFAAAVEELNGYMMAVQGTYQAYGKIKQLSLFDVL